MTHRGEVQAFGADGVLRRRRFSQEEAEFFVSKGMAITLRANRTKTKIICIQWLSDSTPDQLSRPNKWLRTGTRYTKRQLVGSRRLVQHKPLPYRAADLATGGLGTKAVIDCAIRAIFCHVVISQTRA